MSLKINIFKDIMSKGKRYMEIAIKMPVEIAADGSTRLMDEYMRVEYTKCEGLPNKCENDVEKHKAMYSLFVNSIKKEFHNQNPDQNEYKEGDEQEGGEHDEEQEEEQEDEDENKLMLSVEPKEIKNRSPPKRKNTSFKMHRSHSAKYTQRNYR